MSSIADRIYGLIRGRRDHYRAWWNSPDGRIVLGDLIDQCDPHGDPTVLDDRGRVDRDRTQQNIGKLLIINHIRRAMNMSDDEVRRLAEQNVQNQLAMQGDNYGP